jgi:hypothetical protein
VDLEVVLLFWEGILGLFFNFRNPMNLTFNAIQHLTNKTLIKSVYKYRDTTYMLHIQYRDVIKSIN